SKNSSAMRRAASSRRFGSSPLTISSSPGISDVATAIQPTQTRCAWRVFGNLGMRDERRVSRQIGPKQAKYLLNGPPDGRWGLARLRQNRYIVGNLHVSYDRVVRVGP